MAANEFIPLTHSRETGHLLHLCKQYASKLTLKHYVNRYNLRTYEPSVQMQSITFRRIVLVPILSRPVPIEVVRCSENVALIEADQFSGYVLEKVGPSDTDVTIFNIQAKFDYAVRSGDRHTELSATQVPRENPPLTSTASSDPLRFPRTYRF